MKKYLSIVLAVMMVLSSVAYAAPVAVGTVGTANEAEVDVSDVFEADFTEAIVTATTTQKAENILVYNFTFDNLAEGALNRSGASAATYAAETNLPAGFPALKLSFHSSADWSIVADNGSATDKVLYAKPTEKAYTRWYLKTADGSAYPEGTYTLSVTNRMSTDATVSFTYNAVEGNFGLGGLKIGNADTTFTKTFDLVPGSKLNGQTHTAKVHQFECYTASNDIPYYVDDLQIWYKPASYKVSFAGKGALPEAVDVVKNGTFVPSEFAPEYLPDTAEKFLGWSLTNGGAVVEEAFNVTENTTLYAVYEEKVLETTGKYGKLAYYIDFDVASGTAVPSVGLGTTGTGVVSNYTTVNVPAVSGMPAVVELESYGSAYRTDGDSLVMVGQNYPRWWLAAYGEDGSSFASFPKGTYTIEYEAKGDIADALNNVVAVFGNPTVWTNEGWVANTNDFGKFTTDYKVYAGSFTYNGQTVVNANGTTVSGSNSNGLKDFSSGLQKIGLYSGAGSTYNTNKRFYKWVKVWFAPEEVQLSFDANGKDVTVPATATVKSNVTLANYKLSDAGTARFVGWAKTPDGEVITGSSCILTDDTTLYAVWDEHYNASEEEKAAGDLLLHLHFNNMSGVANHHSNIVNYGTLGARYAELLWDGNQQSTWLADTKNADGTYAFGIKYGEYGVAGSYKHPDNSYLITPVFTDNKTHYYKLYFPGNKASLKDGIYTIYAEVTVTETENIARINADSFAHIIKSDADFNGDQALDSAPIAIDGTTMYLKKTLYIKDGRYGSYENMKEFYNVSDVIAKLGFNFSVVPTEGAEVSSAVMECDNFKIYYREYDYAPLSYNESSMRISAPSGIRFKASVSAYEREHEDLKEYGFIVTRKAVLDEAEVSEWSFTQESGVKFAKGAAYGNVNGKDIDKIFATENGRTFYTAVIYNIPADKYDDDLVVRPYIVLGDEVVYGNPMVNNIKAIAQAIKDSADYETYKDAVDKILAGEQL